jgi:hypothetical protein
MSAFEDRRTAVLAFSSRPADLYHHNRGIAHGRRHPGQR